MGALNVFSAPAGQRITILPKADNHVRFLCEGGNNRVGLSRASTRPIWLCGRCTVTHSCSRSKGHPRHQRSGIRGQLECQPFRETLEGRSVERIEANQNGDLRKARQHPPPLPATALSLPDRSCAGQVRCCALFLTPMLPPTEG